MAAPTAPLHRSVITSPLGSIELLATDQALIALRFAGESTSSTDVVDGAGHPVIEAAIAQLTEYFAGERQDFDLPLGAEGTAFQHQAWQALCTIPFGTTISYGEQARRIGDARKARAIGGANGKNPLPIVVPCHRVIGADGSLTGFSAGMEKKIWLLDHERRVLAGTQ